MKSMIRHATSGDVTYDCLAFICPGCYTFGEYNTGLHMLPINTDKTSPAWTWDGNLDSPTISPSILTGKNTPSRRCHSFLTQGIFEFLSDCTHDLAGLKVPMLDLPDWFTKETEGDTDE